MYCIQCETSVMVEDGESVLVAQLLYILLAEDPPLEASRGTLEKEEEWGMSNHNFTF